MPRGDKSRRYKDELKGVLNKEKLKEHFQDYCSSSSIHGVQYVGDSSRPMIERSWWLVIFALSFVLNGYLIYKVWAKWQDSPVIVAFSETTTPVWEVPFPAVTICLQSNSRKHQFHLGTSVKLGAPEEDEMRSAMSLFCMPDVIFNGSLILQDSSIDFLLSVYPDIEDTLTVCKVRNKLVDCEETFKPVMTEDGVCFTYNVLNHSQMFKHNWSVKPYPEDQPEAKHWSLDKGYSKSSPIYSFPDRALTSGDKEGLEVVLSGNISNHDSYCKGPIPGFKLILHNPSEVPSSSHKFIRVPVDQEMLVLLTPSIMTTSETLRSYKPSVRQCFYPDERYLRYFHVYTERNCELECLTNYTLNRCGCATIHMPRDDKTPVCGGGMKECTVDVSYQMRLDELKKSDEGLEEDYCNCLPACTSISYMAEPSQATYQWRKTFEAFGINSSEYLGPDRTMSRVTIFFSDSHFTTVHRSELFGIVDFLANCGGLLGLFSGISFLSFLEIVYFGTIRFWGNIHRDRKQRANVTAEEDEDENMLPS